MEETCERAPYLFYLTYEEVKLIRGCLHSRLTKIRKSKFGTHIDKGYEINDNQAKARIAEGLAKAEEIKKLMRKFAG